MVRILVFKCDETGRKHRVNDVNVITHGCKWVMHDPTLVKGDAAKPKKKIAWYQKSPFGEKVGSGNNYFEDMI